MNQSNEYIAYIPDDECEINLKDLLAGLLLRWKPILACIFIFALLGCGIAFLRATTPASLNARIEDARSQLTAEQAADVESLYARYVGYQEYQRSLQDDYARYLSNASNASNYVLMNASYYLTSSLEGLETVLPQTLLSEEDYTAMRAVSPVDEELSSIYNRVQITSSRSVYFSEENTVVVNVVPDSGNAPVNYYFLITLYGSSEEECEALLNIVDSAMKQTAKSLQQIDSDLMLQLADKKISHNTKDYVNQQITHDREVLNGIESQILSLTNNRISKLSSTEKNYYDLLSQDPQDDEPIQKQVSWKKWTVVGAILGLITGFAVVCCQYLFNGKLKTPSESEVLFCSQTLQRISLPGRKNLFGRWISCLSGADHISADIKVDLVSTDIQLMMEKAGHHRLYLLCDPTDQDAYRIMGLVKDKMLSRNSSLELIAGNPLSSVTDLEKFSSAEDTVIFSELKHSSRETQAKWSELCNRYKIPVIGNVAVEKCW